MPFKIVCLQKQKNVTTLLRLIWKILDRIRVCNNNAFQDCVPSVTEKCHHTGCGGHNKETLHCVRNDSRLEAHQVQAGPAQRHAIAREPIKPAAWDDEHVDVGCQPKHLLEELHAGKGSRQRCMRSQLTRLFRKALGHLDDGMQQVDCADPLTALRPAHAMRSLHKALHAILLCICISSAPLSA